MVSNGNKIVKFILCGKCAKELKEKERPESPKDYNRTQAGWTENGLQVWCWRHNCNIVHIDFEGQKHPANTTIARDSENQSEE